MFIASDLIRGSTDTIILAQLMAGDSYGYEINKAIRDKAGGGFELKEATLYTAFRRLEQLGYISSYWGDEETGARRRYYKITELGGVMYKKMLNDWSSAKTLIDRLVVGNNNRGETPYGI